MPKFHFPIVDGVTLDDPLGVDLKNERQAKMHAETIARHLAQAKITKRNVIVVDDQGTEIHKVPVKD